MLHLIRRLSLISILALGTAGANAQDGAGGIPAVLNSLTALQSSVANLQASVNNTTANSITALQSSVAALQTSVNALAASQSLGNVRYTPLVNVNTTGELASCSAVNVSATQRTVRLQTVKFDGAVVSDVNVVLEPGQANGVGNATGFLYCKATVVNGTVADIRAGMNICTSTACRLTIAGN